MFQSIINFFKSLFGNTAPKAAKIAGVFIAANNKAQAKEILPYANIALAGAKAGTLSSDQLATLMTTIKGKVNDPKFAVLLAAIELPTLQIGTVNEDAVKILDAFIEGASAGVA